MSFYFFATLLGPCTNWQPTFDFYPLCSLLNFSHWLLATFNPGKQRLALYLPNKSKLVLCVQTIKLLSSHSFPLHSKLIRNLVYNERFKEGSDTLSRWLPISVETSDASHFLRLWIMSQVVKASEVLAVLRGAVKGCTLLQKSCVLFGPVNEEVSIVAGTQVFKRIGNWRL